MTPAQTPFQPFKRSILFLIDGARADVMTHEIMQGHLPHLQKFFVQDGCQKTMLTCFPSTTGPAHLPYLTGAFPGTCNIPGIRWFDKASYAKKGWGFRSIRSYCGPENRLLDRDLAANITTAWHVFNHPYNILGGLTKGLIKEHNLTRQQRELYYYYAHLTDRWSLIDHLAAQKLESIVTKREFDFIFTVFPGVDEYAHRTSPFSERTRQAYREADQYIGKTIQMLEDRKILQETLLVIVSDHGLSETTEHFDVGPWLEKEKKIKTLYHTNIFKRKFDAASMVSGNGMCHLYFKDDKGWSGRIPHEDFVKDTDLLAELVARPEVSLVITQAQDETIYFQNKKGCSHFSVDTTQNIIHYTFTQTDPLGIFNNKSINPEEGFTFDKSLELTWDSEYPDVFVQMHQLFRSHRTGDIVLSANSGYDFRNRFEVPLHKASHGALLPEHMKVPLLMNYPIEAQYIRSVDVFPTLLKLMGKAIPSGLDGRCLVG